MDVFKAGAEKHLFFRTYHIFARGDINASRKLDALKFVIERASSTSIKKIIENFAKNNQQIFSLIADQISKLNQIPPNKVYDWFLKNEKFGDQIVEGKKTRVDDYKPKILLLLRAIEGIKIREQTGSTIAKMKNEILTRDKLNEIVKELYEYSLILAEQTYPENMETVYEAEIIKAFAEAQNFPFFSDLAKAIIDKQCADVCEHKVIAQELEQKISTHPSSPECRANQEDNLKYSITKKIFQDALTSYLKQGRYIKMQEAARNAILSDYIQSDEVNWTFIMKGIKEWTDANYLDLSDPNLTIKMPDVVPGYTLNWKDKIANKVHDYWTYYTAVGYSYFF